MIWTVSPVWISVLSRASRAATLATTTRRSRAAAGIRSISMVPDVIFEASKPARVVFMLTALEPSNDADPVTAPAREIVRELARATAFPSVRPVPPRAVASVPDVIFAASRSLSSASMDRSAEPSKLPDPVTAPVRDTVREAASFDAVSTVVWMGCTWSAREKFFADPAEAAPGARGAVSDGCGALST